MDNKITLSLFIDHDREGTYFNLPFEMPPAMETARLICRYDRRPAAAQPGEAGTFTARREANIIDIGLIDPHGRQTGASGSDKTEIFVSETDATPGYTPWPLYPGQWQIMVGAYKVAPAGVNVTYELEFIPKRLRLLKGDLHCHTVASDGVHTLEELAWKAHRNGLDFLAVTDHNQMVASGALPRIPGVTMIPGVEWTHYQGHANFTGVDRPYDAPFPANTFEEALARFQSARERGALITINHPFEDCCQFKLDYNRLPFDCLEIWNGPMRVSNLMAVGLWQSLLQAGRKIPMVGGSDYHRDTPFIFLGGPTTCVYAMSPGQTDILDALRQGHAYVTYAPDGPSAQISAGAAIMGGSVCWEETREMDIRVDGLNEGDMVQVVTGSGSETLIQAPAPGSFEGRFTLKAPGFARLEVWRAFLPGVPQLPALITNPIYFDPG